MAGDSIANTLFIISNASFVAAAVCGIVAIILFFKFHTYNTFSFPFI